MASDAKAEFCGTLYFTKGRLHVEQLTGGLWYAQFITWSGSSGRRMTGMTALRAVNAVREYHGLYSTRRLTGKRAHQVTDRRPTHYRGSHRRGPMVGPGRTKVTA